MFEIHDNEKKAWSHWLNCKVEDFNKKGLICFGNSQLNEANLIYILALKYTFIVSTPSEKHEYYQESFKVLNDFSLISISDILNLLRSDINYVRPILYQSFASPSTINIAEQHSATLLPASEIELLEELKECCSSEEWVQSGLNADGTKDIFAVLQNKRIVAAAHYSNCPGGLASIGVLTHSRYRGNGFGVSAASAAAKNAIDKGLLVHYQTKIENLSSIALANKLGCNQFGYSVTLEMN